MEFSERLEKIIKEKKLSKSQASRKCNIGEAHFYKIARGETKPMLDIIIRICMGLDVQPNDLIPGPWNLD